MFLSIIVPFHNSVGKCERLVATLARLDRDEVELVLVDDGSTDNTREILRVLERSCRATVSIVTRANGGPGAARNSGLDRSSGQYVWFVDSDDDIDLRAISIAKEAQWPEVDLIAWEFEHPNIRRHISPGLHDCTSAPAATDALDPIVANWFSRRFLERTGLRFPEYCVYEATPLEAFVLPLLVSSYFKSEFAAYKGSIDHFSVTRFPQVFNARYYDRLETVPLGMAFAQGAELEPEVRSGFNAAFVRLFLWYSIRLSAVPGLSWVLALRVMRRFRDESRKFGLVDDPFEFYPGRRRSRLVARLLWALSALLPPQDRYFERLRLRAWGREIAWTPPPIPERWRGQAPKQAIPRPPAAAGPGSCPPAPAGP